MRLHGSRCYTHWQRLLFFKTISPRRHRDTENGIATSRIRHRPDSRGIASPSSLASRKFLWCHPESFLLSSRKLFLTVIPKLFLLSSRSEVRDMVSGRAAKKADSSRQKQAPRNDSTCNGTLSVDRLDPETQCQSPRSQCPRFPDPPRLRGGSVFCAKIYMWRTPFSRAKSRSVLPQ